MKLAEALMRRADCQKRFEQLKSRLLNNAKVQEGDVPAETQAFGNARGRGVRFPFYN